MDGQRFDALARQLATGVSRRAVLRGLAGSVTAGVATLLGGAGADARRVTQAYCGNAACANEPIACNAGCVCCTWANGNSRCMPPRNCRRLGGTESCTGGERMCPDGRCVPVDNCCSAADCDDGNQCTTDSCTAEGTCQHVTKTCAAGNVCDPASGDCVRCGAISGDPCCDGHQCNDPELVCDTNDICRLCGIEETRCCANSTCRNGYICDTNNMCQYCGSNVGEPCCTGGTCNPPHLVCDDTNNICVTPCGGASQRCCENNSCPGAPNLVCSPDGMCQGCGYNGLLCCAESTCELGNVCTTGDGMCHTCGISEGDLCCAGNTCIELNLTCTAEGTCECGGKSEPCCGVDTCDDEDLVCTDDRMCVSCGDDHEPCCAGGTCHSTTSAPLACADDNTCQ